MRCGGGGRRQALELIKLVLDQPGDRPVFHGGEKFAYAIKQYLCSSLFSNLLESPFPAVFETCMDIFAALVARFSDHLKTELGVFFNDVFFRVLEVRRPASASARGPARWPPPPLPPSRTAQHRPASGVVRLPLMSVRPLLSPPLGSELRLPPQGDRPGDGLQPVWPDAV